MDLNALRLKLATQHHRRLVTQDKLGSGAPAPIHFFFFFFFFFFLLLLPSTTTSTTLIRSFIHSFILALVSSHFIQVGIACCPVISRYVFGPTNDAVDDGGKRLRVCQQPFRIAGK